MKTLYLDCATGISGDMTLAALIDAGVDADAIRTAIDSLGLAEVRLEVRRVLKGGFRATKVDVRHPEQHAHRHLGDIRRILDGAGQGLTDSQRSLALRIFSAIAEAEAHVHGTTIDRVHFHEVGAIDSIVDIVGAAVGFDLLGAEQIVCSPIPTGRGTVDIDHGACAVPTPGTAELLKSIPLVDLPIDAELTTPTGAAIVRTVADSFGSLPAMTIHAIGYGAGTMDLDGRANLLRLFVGETVETPERDVVTLLETNLDNVTGEVVGHAKQVLLAAGALDAWSTSIQMKKDRPGVLLAVLCRPVDAPHFEELLFRETGTLGVRRTTCERSKLSREEVEVDTPWGVVHGKVASGPGVRQQFTPEYEDCRRIAEQSGVPLREIMQQVREAFDVSRTRRSPSPATAPPSRPHRHDHDHSHSHDHGHDHAHDHDHGR